MEISPNELRELLDEEYNRGLRDGRRRIKLPIIDVEVASKKINDKIDNSYK